jgi:hypothetical protein
MNMAKKDKIIFIHIPKTGGTTLQGIVNREYGLKKICSIATNRKITKYKTLSSVEKEKIKILQGHMAFGHHVHFPNPDAVSYFTMLRNPISRIISNYYFIFKLKDKHRAYKEMVAKNYSLKEFVESGIITNTENIQVRLLSNNIDTPYGGCTREMLETAKHNLENYFSVVGINEQFDESLFLLKKHYGWKKPYYLRGNVTGHGVKVADLDEETLKTITSYNALDIELYEWVKKRLALQIADQGPDFQKRVTNFQKQNLWVQRAIKIKRKLIPS